MVLITLRVRIEKICTRMPVVTAKWSLLDGRRGLGGGGGNEICVIGKEPPGEGIRNWDRKDFQYCCSGVMGEGPLGSFVCCNFVTGAAISAQAH